MRPEDMFLAILFGQNEHQVGVGSKIEFAHSKAPDVYKRQYPLTAFA